MCGQKKRCMNKRKLFVKMTLKESKTTYMFFTRSRQKITTRLTVNGKFIECEKHIKLLGLWLQEDGVWGNHVKETWKKAYMRMSFLTKLRYAGISRGELIYNYKH